MTTLGASCQANAIFFNHGQCCCAGSRLFVEEERPDAVVSGLAEIAKSIKVGSGKRSRRGSRFTGK